MKTKNVTDYELDNVSIYTPTKEERNYAFLGFSLALKHGKVKCGKHCSIIYDENYEIKSSFVNERLTGRKTSIHSETGAINMCCPEVNLSKCTIMVIRASNLGVFSMSRPCLDCYTNIKNAGIKTIIYSYNNEQFERIMLT